MPSSLKRIETQHKPYDEHNGCPEYQQYGDPCDVVKLARALDLWRRSHLDNCTGCTDCNFALQAERTLKEVAGD